MSDNISLGLAKNKVLILNGQNLIFVFIICVVKMPYIKGFIFLYAA